MKRATLFLAFVLLSVCLYADVEPVVLLKVMDADSSAIIQRRNGEQYLIEHGVGVISIWRYEGKAVYISSPGLFLGVGSEILLPDSNQKARIWNSKQIGSGYRSSPSPPPIQQLGYGLSDSNLSLFAQDGRPVAYVVMDEDFTIYLWDGTPVAYFVGKSDCFSIYGFNGKHLGWFENGIVRDHQGFGVGLVEGAVGNVFTLPEPVKSIKKIKPIKAIRQIEPIKPVYRDYFSEIPLYVFLASGR